MAETKHSADGRDAAVEQTDIVNYLPGTPQLSTEPSVVERFLTTLFRRRGEYRLVGRRPRR
jgi:hypothetical protein